MANLNNITSKILKDAEDRKNEILAEAEEEKKSILSKKIAKAKDLEAEKIKKAKLEAQSKIERAISSAKLKVRNDKLEVKQEIINSTFVKSIEVLANLKGEELLKFIKSSVLSLGNIGEQEMILNKTGMESIDLTFIYELNKELGDRGNIKLSSEVKDFKGGFILEKDGIQINYTFEALVNSLKDELEYEVASILFN